MFDAPAASGTVYGSAVPAHASVRCRPIEAADGAGVIDLLTRSFPLRTRDYWVNALAILARRDTPEGFPRFGYMLECDGRCVGVVLLIFSTIQTDGGSYVRANGSSWCVEPAFRPAAAALLSTALRCEEATYLNVSPAPHTRPMMTAQGFIRYSEGLYASWPTLARFRRGLRVRWYRPESDGPRLADPALPRLFADHMATGCLVLVCERRGKLTPLMFLRRDIVGVGSGVVQLAWCEHTAAFVRDAGPVGRFLLRHRFHTVLLDAAGPVEGLIGRFYPERTPKYFKGPVRPRLNDLAYTEGVLFGA